MPYTSKESDFVIINLDDIFASYDADANVASVHDKRQSSQQSSSKSSDTNASIESELMSQGINEHTVKKIMTFGEPLKKVLRVLGFKKDDPKTKKNPIMAFIKQKYVQNNLINNGLLNINTFKPIYNAVSKKLVANSEFFNVNDYNIIYCKALYKKPAAEIEEYITLQSKVLGYSATSYPAELLKLNKKLFLAGASSNDTLATQNATELNDLNFIRKLVGSEKSDMDKLVSKILSAIDAEKQKAKA